MEKVRVSTNAVSQLMCPQLRNGRVGEQNEGGNGVITCVYFKGQIVQVVGKERRREMTSDD